MATNRTAQVIDETSALTSEHSTPANNNHRNHDGVSTFEMAELLAALQAMRNGDFSVRLPGDWTELGGKIADRFNEIVSSNARMAKELTQVGEVVGKEGKAQQRVKFDPSSGAWGEMELSANTLIEVR